MMISRNISRASARPQQAARSAVRVQGAKDSPVHAVLQNAATLAVAVGIALSPAPAFAALPDGVSGPGQTELDELLTAKLEKIRASGLANENPSGAPVRVETTYDADRKPLNATKTPAAEPVRAAAPAEEERIDIRQAAIDAAATPPLEAGRPVAAAKAAPAQSRAAPSSESAAPAPNTAALAGVAVLALGAVAAAAASNKGEEQQQAATPAAPLAAEAAPEGPTEPTANETPAPAGK